MTDEEITKTSDHLFRLFLIDPDGKHIPIKDLPATIGRGGDNDVQLLSDTISDNHARIFYDSKFKAVCIEDLNSRNGTFIEGKPTLKNILQDGIEIRFAKLSYIYRHAGFIPAG